MAVSSIVAPGPHLPLMNYSILLLSILAPVSALVLATPSSKTSKGSRKLDSGTPAWLLNFIRYISVILAITNVILESWDLDYWPKIPFMGDLAGNIVVLSCYRVIEVLFIWEDDSRDDEAGEKKARGVQQGNLMPKGSTRRQQVKESIPQYASKSFFERTALACDKLFSNPRQIGTSRQVKGVPPFSSIDPSYSPSLKYLLLRRISKAIVCYCILDLMTSRPPTPVHLVSTENIVMPLTIITRGLRLVFSNHYQLADEKLESSLSMERFKKEQLIFRPIVSVSFWTIIYLMLQFLHGAMSVLYILTGRYEAADLPPAFGSISKARTIRGFWNSFWHQVIRSPITSLASAIVDNIMPEALISGQTKKLIRRYLRIFLAFFLSGVSHAISHISVRGYNLSVFSGCIIFFSIQAVGIAIEDGVQYLWKSWTKTQLPRPENATGKRNRNAIDATNNDEHEKNITVTQLNDGISETRQPSSISVARSGLKSTFIAWFETIIGYAWTLFWISLTAPIWAYPQLQLRPKQEMLAYSFVRGKWNY